MGLRGFRSTKLVPDVRLAKRPVIETANRGAAQDRLRQRLGCLRRVCSADRIGPVRSSSRAVAGIWREAALVLSFDIPKVEVRHETAITPRLPPNRTESQGRGGAIRP